MAFQRLIQMTVISDQVIKLNNLRQKIKNLMNSFIIKDEKFIKNSYSAKFDVNFNKQNTILFLKKKIFFHQYLKKKAFLYYLFLLTHRIKILIYLTKIHFLMNGKTGKIKIYF